MRRENGRKKCSEEKAEVKMRTMCMCICVRDLGGEGNVCMCLCADGCVSVFMCVLRSVCM